MTLVQNQGKRIFILPEGTVNPMGSINLPEERAEKLCREYHDFVKLEIQEAKTEEPNKNDEEEKEVALIDLARGELMKRCKEQGIVYEKNATKADLIALLEK